MIQTRSEEETLMLTNYTTSSSGEMLSYNDQVPADKVRLQIAAILISRQSRKQIFIAPGRALHTNKKTNNSLIFMLFSCLSKRITLLVSGKQETDLCSLDSMVTAGSC